MRADWTVSELGSLRGCVGFLIYDWKTRNKVAKLREEMNEVVAMPADAVRLS